VSEVPPAAAGVLEVGVERPDRGVDVAFAVAAGEVVALLGPPGAGRSTVLRAVAGLDGPHGGIVRCDGEVWDRAGQQRTPAGRRRVGWLAGTPLLLRHLDVRDNVALAVDGGRLDEVSRSAADVALAGVGLGGLGGRRVRELSPGQAVRVALARALARDPAVLLLDDPMAALDAPSRAEVRRHLARAADAFRGPVVVTADDPLDAVALADRAVVVEDGLVVQEGDGRTLVRRPATTWIARHVGVNLYRGRADGGRVEVAGAEQVLQVATDVRGPVLVRLRPQAVALHRARPIGSARNVWHAGLVGVHGWGRGRVRVALTGRLQVVAEITTAAAAELDLARGGGIWAAVKATDVEVLPA
jgi:molybdate transport system ATP-binding protein